MSSPDLQLAPPAFVPSPMWRVAALSVVCAAGAAGWALWAVPADPHRAWRAMLIGFIFFNPLAVGMVVWSAVVTAARGGWMGRAERVALGGAFFAPVALAAFALLYTGRHYWAHWMDVPNLHNAAWLNVPFLFGRDAAALVLFWTLAIAFMLHRRRGGASKKFAGWFVFAYAMVGTLLAFDLVMALDPHWFSTLFGAYVFITGLYIAMAAWSFIGTATGQIDRPRRHDLGKLIVAFSLLATYLMFSQLLAIWYENLPEEVRFVIPRLRTTSWPVVSAVLVCTVYLGPLVLLILRKSKMNRLYLGAVSLMILCGMFVERWWLVTPTLGGPMVLGLTEATAVAAFGGALAFCLCQYWAWKEPQLPRREAQP